MKKLLTFAFAALILAGCTKNDEPLPEVSFSINVSGFNITTDDFGSLKSTEALFDGFEHKYPAGILRFNAPSGAVYTFDTNGESIEDFVFSLSPGTYQIVGEGGTATVAGSDAMPFIIDTQSITIEESTTEISVTVTPTCGLILVSDASGLVESAMMTRYETPDYDFYTDGIFYYTYFGIGNNWYAEITKTGGFTLTLYTPNLQIGYAYQIEVTDAAGSMSLGLDANFTEAETVVW